MYSSGIEVVMEEQLMIILGHFLISPQNICCLDKVLLICTHVYMKIFEKFIKNYHFILCFN